MQITVCQDKTAQKLPVWPEPNYSLTRPNHHSINPGSHPPSDAHI